VLASFVHFAPIKSKEKKD